MNLDQPTPEDTIQAEHIHTLWRYAGAASISHVFDVVVLVALLWGTVPQALLLGWSAFLLTAVLARLAASLVYRQRGPDAVAWRRWALTATLFMAVFGATWGATAVLFLDFANPISVIIVVTLIVGLNAGAASISASYLPAYFTFLITSYSPMLLVLVMHGDPLGIGLAVLVAGSFLVNILVCLNAHKTLDHALRLRFENEALHREAQQANAAKTRFLAAASHDLRQPVHALGLSFATLADQVRGADTAPLIEHVTHSIEAVGTMLNTLLDISKLDAGVVSPQPCPLSVQSLFDQLQGEYHSMAHESGNRLRLRPSRAWVRSDPAMLLRVLENLIANALRYTAHGRVLVVARRRGDQLRFEVHDSGIGIPRKRFDDIFVEFQQLGNPQRDRQQGLGLGLAIVKRLCVLLGHPITLHSQLGRGTCFGVSVPLAPARPCGSTGAAKPAEAPGNELVGRCVLVLEDDMIVRHSMQHLLESWGCRVVTAAGVDEALRVCNGDHVPALLIVDYRLPGSVTGLDAIPLLREALGAGVPAMVITGDTAPERLREATASGYPLLHKPVQPARLRSAVRQLMRKGAG